MVTFKLKSILEEVYSSIQVPYNIENGVHTDESVRNNGEGSTWRQTACTHAPGQSITRDLD